MKKVMMMTAVAALALVNSGCLCARVKTNDENVIARSEMVRPGVTKASELQGILQADPDMMLPGAKGTLYTYTVSDTKNEGLMLFVVNFMKANVVLKTLYIEVDEAADKVLDVRRPKAADPKWEFWPFD